MKTLILDGSSAGDQMGGLMAGVMRGLLVSRGDDVEHVVLRDKKIANCAGCFLCWFKSPGICVKDDDNGDLAKKFIQSDLVVILTPVIFGTYSPELKRMVDHLIANVLPFFCTVGGETHHRKRYETYPATLTIGWLDAPDEEQEGIFRHLSYRNSINFYQDSAVSGIVYRNQGEAEVGKKLDMLLAGTERRASTPVPVLPDIAVSGNERGKLRRAVLLVGSPRMAKSSSGALGGYLFDRLEAAGVATERFYLYQVVDDSGKMDQMLEAIDRADLTVLSFPLYVDSIPAPVLSVMRFVAEHRRSAAQKSGFAAIVNCGFIEAFHNENALASCASFAVVSGFSWMGSMSIGGGEGLVHGRPLQELGGPATAYKQALDRVAVALADGGSVPEAERRQLAKPFVPGWIYRMAGTMGWKKRARHYGTQKRLEERPYRRP